MRRLAVFLLLLPLPLLRADDRPAAMANHLTTTEIQQGWILLFDGKTTFGWKVDGEATVTDGWLVLGGKRETVAETTTALPAGELRAEIAATPQPPRFEGWVGAALRPRDGKRQQSIDLRRQPVHLRVPESEASALPVRFVVPAGSTLSLRSVAWKPAGATPLFNGKDLTGWKQFQANPKQARSRFSVTREGWLNVKDGPGDLQTERTCADFVVQLDCLSNGTHLNSGLFFRCLPEQYQQGYEMQIRNQFTPGTNQKYTVEEYDATTHKLTGKRVVESPTVDYGTGAIYRRVPARSGVSKDGEWFTLTLIAHGRHIATWVNGVQQVDWTDNRPASDNARQGYRGAAGALSIQGHDPTTDLSFRNLRIVELPSAGK